MKNIKISKKIIICIAAIVICILAVWIGIKAHNKSLLEDNIVGGWIHDGDTYRTILIVREDGTAREITFDAKKMEITRDDEYASYNISLFGVMFDDGRGGGIRFNYYNRNLMAQKHLFGEDYYMGKTLVSNDEKQIIEIEMNEFAGDYYN